MYKLLRRYLKGRAQDDASSELSCGLSRQLLSLDEVWLNERKKIRVEDYLDFSRHFPIFDWDRIFRILEQLDEDRRISVLEDLETIWLLRMQKALGERFYFLESSSSILLSPVARRGAVLLLDYMDISLERINSMLPGIVDTSSPGKEILILFDDLEEYTRYVSAYWDGVDGYSGDGIHIDVGCSHYVALMGDMASVEVVITHEMVHGCLSHLPLPTWLNEGLAVFFERTLKPGPTIFTSKQAHQNLLAFWNDSRIQDFWSGKSFDGSGQDCVLSYELAYLVVRELKLIERFDDFVLNAHYSDAGAGAAQNCLGIQLGAFVCALLDLPLKPTWNPCGEFSGFRPQEH